jgi:hypothetical protein
MGVVVVVVMVVFVLIAELIAAAGCITEGFITVGAAAAARALPVNNMIVASIRGLRTEFFLFTKPLIKRHYIKILIRS